MIVLRLLINAIAVYVASRIVPGIGIDAPSTVAIVTVVLGVLNTFLKPLLVVLTLPVTVVTLGLFLLVINAAVVILAGRLVPGFHVGGFWSAVGFSIVVSLVGSFLSSIAE